MIAYKLFTKHKDGSISSLFINRRSRIPLGEWLNSECITTPGFKVRQGWHCCEKPIALHLSMRDRVWYKVSIAKVTALPRPKSQGAMWYIGQRMKVLEPV